MLLEKFLSLFTSKDKFLPLFSVVTKQLVEMSSLLDAIHLKQPEDRGPDFDRIYMLRNKVEDKVQNINLELSRNFITPFDREDIYTLSKSLNDVAGYIKSAANKMNIYQVTKITKSINKLTSACLESCVLLDVSIQYLPIDSKRQSILEACKRVSKLERKSDGIFEKAVFDIFDGDKSTKDIIKYKEILSALENATDKCKSVANTIELIIVKSA